MRQAVFEMNAVPVYSPLPSLDSRDHFERMSARGVEKHLAKQSHCGRWSLRGTSAETRHYLRVNCKCWDCTKCGPRRAGHYKRAIREQAQANKLQRFLTLTLDPSHPMGTSEDHAIYLSHLTLGKNCDCAACLRIKGASVAYIRDCWNKLRKYIARGLGKMPAFIAVLEFQQKKTGLAHLHVLLGSYIDREWIAKSWAAVGGGSHVDIRAVDVHRISHYLAKYLTKELLMSAPKRSRRVTCSRSIKLNAPSEKSKEIVWELLKAPLPFLFSMLGKFAIEISYDTDGTTLQGFVVLNPVLRDDLESP
jgi:hypothetical protein